MKPAAGPGLLDSDGGITTEVHLQLWLLWLHAGQSAVRRRHAHAGADWLPLLGLLSAGNRHGPVCAHRATIDPLPPRSALLLRGHIRSVRCVLPLKNLDFLSKHVDFLLKNVDLIIKRQSPPTVRRSRSCLMSRRWSTITRGTAASSTVTPGSWRNAATCAAMRWYQWMMIYKC